MHPLELCDLFLGQRMVAVGLDGNERNVARRIIFPEAGIDGVAHQHTHHFQKSVRGHGRTQLIPLREDVFALKPRDRFVAVLFAQAINKASVTRLRGRCQLTETC